MTEKTVTLTIDENHLACAMGSGSLAVLATPAVAALMENAAATLAEEILADDTLTTVGTMIAIEHTSPTPLGATISATARLVGHEGRLFDFEVTAADPKGEIAHGTHRRVSVKAATFQEKADEKLHEIPVHPV